MFPVAGDGGSTVKAVKIENEHPLPPGFEDRMAEAGLELVLAECETGEALEACAREAEIVWLYSGRRVLGGDNLPRIPHCGLILRVGSGTDNVDVPRATELGIVVANTPRANAEHVCDHTIAIMLAVQRQIVRHDRAMRRGRGDAMDPLPLRSLPGATLGLVGFGRAPQRMATRLRGFEMRIMAYDPFVSPDVMGSFGVTRVSLEALLAAADYVSLHCAYRPETHHILGREQMALMKPGAVLINTARGKLVDEGALLEALRTGHFAAAGLDVFHDEPLAPDHPLRRMENVVLTPHAAGHSAQFPDECYEEALSIFAGVAAGNWPATVVNPGVNPRWDLLAKAKETACPV